MLDKIKQFIKKQPMLSTVAGGGLLFVLYLLFARPGRREHPPGMPLQVIPGQRFEPPVSPGEAPAWEEAWARFQEQMRGELAGLREEFRREDRPAGVHIIQEIIRERLPDAPAAPIAPVAPVAPVAPAPVAPAPVAPAPVAPAPVAPAPVAPAPDPGLAARLRADIARVEARAADPGFRERMAEKWGSVEQYIAGQRARLRKAGG